MLVLIYNLQKTAVNFQLKNLKAFQFLHKMCREIQWAQEDCFLFFFLKSWHSLSIGPGIIIVTKIQASNRGIRSK